MVLLAIQSDDECFCTRLVNSRFVKARIAGMSLGQIPNVEVRCDRLFRVHDE